MIQPVVLCGGSGTRLWPLSRADRPKPFLPLLGDRTLFQQTLDRLDDGALFARPLIVAGETHVPLVEQQAAQGSLMVEPAARNTAPAIALAAARVEPDTVLLVCPSDHHIADREAFRDAVKRAEVLAKADYLVCFGIEPDRPETGYGYIEKGEALGSGHRVARFIEKPEMKAAQEYLDSGNFAWNSGMFVFRAGAFLDELARHRPDMADAVRHAVHNGRLVRTHFHPEKSAFDGIEGESVDYAVMENTDRAAVVSADIGWSDIGDWDSLMNAREAAGLDLLADGTQTIGASGIMTVGEDRRISVVGLDNVIVVVDGEDVLVLSRDAAQAVKILATDKSK